MLESNQIEAIAFSREQPHHQPPVNLPISQTCVEELQPLSWLTAEASPVNELSALKARESRYAVWLCGTLSLQSEVNSMMRAVLVDWMLEALAGLGHTRQSFQLAVSYLDRYLSIRKVGLGKLQLLGLAAMLVATKLEEGRAQPLAVLVETTENAFSVAELKAMELELSKTLQCDEILSWQSR